MSNKLNELLQKGLAAHQAGRLDAAEIAYRGVLSINPCHPDALHLCALIQHEHACHEAAAALAKSAVAAAPGIANFRNTLGNSLRLLGEVDAAIRELNEAVRLDPRCAFAFHNLALCHESKGEFGAARDCEHRALAINPSYADALINALRLASREGDDESAALLHQQLITRVDPTEQAISASYAYRMGVAKSAISRRDLTRAASFAASASELMPGRHEAWVILGEIANLRLDYRAAERYLAIAANVSPNDEGARLSIATFLLEQRRFDEAEAHYRAWLQCDPQSPRAKFGLAWVALAQGRYADAWPLYESRWDHPDHLSPRFTAAPQWDGKPVGHLLLYAEQGLGDAVMMLRFVAGVLAMPLGKVSLLVPPPLRRIAARLSADPRFAVIAAIDETHGIDAACPLMSLPLCLGVRSETGIAIDAPYLHPDPQRTEDFRRRLTCFPGRKIGLVWQGGAASQQNGRRRLPEEALAPLFALPGWSVVSLQVGNPGPVAGRMPIDICSEIADFDDLAAAMAAVDVVVSVDSGPAHLAGALGLPCYMLLPWLYDWRWPSAGEVGDWYASVRVVRQEKPDQWDSAIKGLLERLTGQANPAAAPTVTTSAHGRAGFPFVKIETRHGLMTVPMLDHYIARSLMIYGEYSSAEWALLHHFVRDGDTVLDVGANVGAFALPLARAVGPRGRVLAFEPQPLIAECLAATFRENAIENAQLIRAAVGAARGHLRIAALAADRPANFGGVGRTEGSAGTEVELLALDDLNLPECHLIKIDVEGAEAEVLRGAANLIARCRPVIQVECDRQGSERELGEMLARWGYCGYLHQPPLHCSDNFRQFGGDVFPGLISGNLIALPKERQAPTALGLQLLWH